MSQVEKLEALLAKVQANRQVPRVTGAGSVPQAAVAAASVPAPLASQSPISVAPPPESAVASEPPDSLLDDAPTSMSPDKGLATEDSSPSIEVGAPSGAAQFSPESVTLPQVLAESGSPWQVLGEPATTPKTATFLELLEHSLSLSPRT